MDDYERRFQRSLQKLTIPLWYTDITPTSNIASSGSKQSIISTTSIPWKTHYRETQRTPEIIHLQHPHNHRSCRSSLATSPSPSMHSWHPNHMIDGVTFSLLKPSSTSSRRYNRYEKGIERVSKSSRWYRPTQFVPNKIANSQTGTSEIPTSIRHNQQSTKNNHYDAPKIYNNDGSLISKSKCLVTNGSVVENIIVNEQNNNVIANDTQQENHINSNESQIMPMADTNDLFSRIELVDITDKEDDNQLLSMESNKSIPSITNLSLSNEQINHNELLERTANDLVESLLTDILLLNNIDDDVDEDDDKNSGVRELSDDENGLRELDENDMNDTDEFIVFATNAELSDNDDDQSSNTQRCSLNRLYTFSRTNNNCLDDLKQNDSNQNLPKLIIDQDEKTLNCQTNSKTNELFDKFFHSSPIYHFHIEKQDINLHKYIDKMMYPSNRQLLTNQTHEGVNEETARIGRLLLNSIPTPCIENIHDSPSVFTADQPLLENTRCIITDHDNNHESIQKNFHPLTIEEYQEELNDKVRRDSAYSSNQERINIPQSYYEPLSECYSGFSYIQSDFLTPNVSSIQSTTDEAYESEPTTMSSSIATTTTTTHVHPDLEHEFEYPLPPPVPDRSLKPAYLKSITKPPLTKQNNTDSAGYSIIQKTKPSPLIALQQILTTTTNSSTSSSAKIMSSRHYCGSIPVSNEPAQSSVESTPIKTNGHLKDKKKEKRTSKTLSCLYPSTADDNNNRRNLVTKSTSSSSSSSNKPKIKKQKLITDFDEATNGLAIRLPAPISNGNDIKNKQNLNRSSTLLSNKRANGMTKSRQISDNIKSDRLPFYETSV
ncbi:unnamed protein product [Adineta steineri]|uniref:Uncharacterized protein n=1 Tax=Adineta steineri TaxID=433720 RepID=A0A815L5K1_9BILA|nr:unnamed protein product [Adineta steineri]CAF3688672.1 unnamed protein product [Adineta steineri]